MFLGRKSQYCGNDYTTKCSLQIQCNPYQITNSIFHRTRTKSFTVHLETQKTLNSQSSLRKKNGTGGINLPDFILYYKLQSSRKYGACTKTEIIDQWNKIENLCTYGYFIFEKGGKNIKWGKDSLFNK